MLLLIKKWYLRNRISMLVFLVIALVLVNTPNSFESNPVLEAYVKKVERLSKGNIKSNIQINFADLNTPVIGTCYQTAIRYIEIDKEAFDVFTEKKRLLVIAHELAHCQCNYDHIEILDSNSCPYHFMYPATPSFECLYKNWNRYVRQMKELDC